MDAAAPQPESASPLMKFLKGAGSVSKLAVGAGTLAMGVAFVSTFSPLGILVVGGIALVAGGRQAYEAGKELFGNTPAEKPSIKTRLGRVADSLGIGATGALGFFIGGFALGMGGAGAGLAVLVLGGAALMAASVLQLGTQAFTAIRDTVQHVQASKAAKQASPLPAAPDLSPKSNLSTLEAAPGFEKAASPEATVAAPAPQPVIAPPAPRA